MKKLLWLLVLMVTVLSSQVASAACSYPQGSVGTQVYENGFITSWTRNPTPDAHGKYSKFDATFTFTNPNDGPPFTDSIDWGDNNVNIQGPGWSGAKVLTTRMTSPQSLGSHSDPTVCDYGPNIWCWIINENTNAFRFDASQAATMIVLGTGSQTGHHGTGITKLRGMGVSDPKKMRMYSFDASHVSQFLSATMSTGGCVAALDVARDWRLAFAAPKHPDALTIEALLFG